MFLFEFIQEPLGCHQKDDDALQKGNHLRIQIRRTGHDLCTDPQVRDEKRGQRNEYRVLIGQHVDKKTVPHIVHLALPVETLVHTDHLNGAAHTGEDTAHELCQQDDLPGLDTGCLGEFRVDTGDTHLITEGSLLHQHHNENNGCDEDEETVTISKEQYEDMIDDLLTMAELIDMVSDMRTKDIRFIQEMAKLMPAYAEYEKSRLALYREAAKEAEAIFDRWEDELDEDYEPDEYFSD